MSARIGSRRAEARGAATFGARPARPSKTRSAFLASLVLLSAFAYAAAAQNGGGHTIYGDLKVDDTKAEGLKPISFTIFLYSVRGGSVIARQTVPKNGRYRFENVANGSYEIVVQMENAEVTRVRVTASGAVSTDFRQDISLEWRSSGGAAAAAPAEDAYARTAENQKLFALAEDAMKKKRHEEALSLFGRVTASDPKDFEAWTEAGTVNFILGRNGDAESAYARALEARPAFGLALVNLGKLRMAGKDFKGAVEVLTRAVAARPKSADAQHLLGEAYLSQAVDEIRRGSQAVDELNELARQAVFHLNEALRLDPAGKAEVHLRLADIYNVMGMKEEAAAECEKLLAQRPDYPDRKRLEQFIRENKKQ